jgi:hypothetical protein
MMSRRKSTADNEGIIDDGRDEVKGVWRLFQVALARNRIKLVLRF